MEREFASKLESMGFEPIDRDYPYEDGFEHYCFGCAPNNPISMKMEFFARAADKEVATILVVKPEYCGFPLYAHGGIISLVLDEVLAYATYYHENNFGLTKSMSVAFKRPVLIGKPHFVRATVKTSAPHPKGVEIVAEGSIHEGTSASGRACACAEATLVVVPREQLKATYKKGS